MELREGTAGRFLTRYRHGCVQQLLRGRRRRPELDGAAKPGHCQHSQSDSARGHPRLPAFIGNKGGLLLLMAVLMLSAHVGDG